MAQVPARLRRAHRDPLREPLIHGRWLRWTPGDGTQERTPSAPPVSDRHCRSDDLRTRHGPQTIRPSPRRGLGLGREPEISRRSPKLTSPACRDDGDLIALRHATGRTGLRPAQTAPRLSQRPPSSTAPRPFGCWRLPTKASNLTPDVQRREDRLLRARCSTTPLGDQMPTRVAWTQSNDWTTSSSGRRKPSPVRLASRLVPSKSHDRQLSGVRCRIRTTARRVAEFVVGQVS